MISIVDMLKKTGDAAQILERIDMLFEKVEAQGNQILQLQSEIIRLNTVLVERNIYIEKIIEEKEKHLKSEVSNIALSTIGDRMIDLNDRFNEKMSKIQMDHQKLVELNIGSDSKNKTNKAAQVL